MAFLGETIEVSSLPESTGYDLIPAGWYEASITEASVKDTKDSSGKYIKLRYDILGPSYQGRAVWGNLNIRNSSLKAEEIGRQQLGDILRCAGKQRIADSDELVGIRLQIKVAIRAGNDQYEASNEVKGFKPVAGSGSAAPFPGAKGPAPAPAPAAPMPPSASTPPWRK
jgi:hypothetical protein